MSESSIFVIGGSSASARGVEGALRSLSGAMRLRQHSELRQEPPDDPDLDGADRVAHRLRVRTGDAT